MSIKAAVSSFELDVENSFNEELDTSNMPGKIELLGRFYSEVYSKVLALKEVILDLQESKSCTLNGGRNLEIILENLTVITFFINSEKGIYEITESVFNDIIEEFDAIPYKLAISTLSGKLAEINVSLGRESNLTTPCYNCLVWINEEVKRLNKIG